MGSTSRRVVAGVVATWTAFVFVAVCLAACGAVPVGAAEHACCKKPAGADGAELTAVTADCCAQPAMVKPAAIAMPSLITGVALAFEFALAPVPLAVVSVRLPTPSGVSPPFVLRV